MTQVSIVYHSGYGHTAEQAKAVGRGVEKVEGVTLHLLTAEEAQQQ
jgi:NAD(P)H dehydrogenase (quinone)